MPKIYQAYCSNVKNDYRYHSTSRTKILTEARTVAKTMGKEVKVDMLEIEPPSMKYLIALLNGARPLKRERLYSFVPRGAPIVVTKGGETTKVWKVKKQS